MKTTSSSIDESFEKQAYDMPELWEDDWFGEADQKRVQKILQIIPSDALTLLDVGCGNGLFLNFASKTMPHRFTRLCGIDRSDIALAHVRTEKQSARVNQIPYGNQDFDIVTCMEVLEHLPLHIYSSALGEIARVARKYVLLSVPYREDLVQALATCPSCHAKFHPDYHVRSFDESSMASLLNQVGFSQIGQWKLGESLHYPDRELRAYFGRILQMPEMPSFPAFGLCPVCGYRDARKMQQELANRRRHKTQTEKMGLAETEEKLSHMRRLISKIMPPVRKFRWIASLYQRVG